MEHLKSLDKLIITGNAAESWKRWRQRWDLYVKASGANEKAEDIQCALLLHMIGEDALRVYETFVFADADKNLITPLIQKFEEHFNPQKNVTFERYIFNTCCQNSRPIDVYLVDLKNKAKTCEYGDLNDQMIRDRLIVGIDSVGVREKLLRTKKLTLDKAVEYVRSVEKSHIQVAKLNSATPEQGSSSSTYQYDTDAIYYNNNNNSQKYNNSSNRRGSNTSYQPRRRFDGGNISRQNNNNNNNNYNNNNNRKVKQL